MTTMPFGRHRGAPLDEIDADYLRWLLTIELRDHREHRTPPPPTVIVPVALRATADQIITAGLRALTRRYHPDCGGTHAQMVSVNLAAEALRQVVAR